MQVLQIYKHKHNSKTFQAFYALYLNTTLLQIRWNWKNFWFGEVTDKSMVSFFLTHSVVILVMLIKCHRGNYDY